MHTLFLHFVGAVNACWELTAFSMGVSLNISNKFTEVGKIMTPSDLSVYKESKKKSHLGILKCNFNSNVVAVYARPEKTDV